MLGLDPACLFDEAINGSISASGSCHVISLATPVVQGRSPRKDVGMSTAGIPKRFAMNAAVTVSLEDRLADLGGIAPSRVRAFPAPGSATLADLIESQQTDNTLCELVDGTLVEKPMGWRESLLAMALARWLGNFLESQSLGVVTGPDGTTRLFGNTVRAADVAYFSWERMPNGKLPTAPVPELVPDFVIEVLSISNTRGEMARKRREYFQAGVRLVWMVDAQSRTVAVYTDPESFRVATEEDVINGGDVLPAWEVDLRRLFGKLDGKRETASHRSSVDSEQSSEPDASE